MPAKYFGLLMQTGSQKTPNKHPITACHQHADDCQPLAFVIAKQIPPHISHAGIAKNIIISLLSVKIRPAALGLGQQ